MAEKGSVWTSIPGVVGGIAATVTGLVGLATVANQAGWLGGDDNKPASKSDSTTTSTPVDGSTTTVFGSPTTPFGGSSGLGGAGIASVELAPSRVVFGGLGGGSQRVTVTNEGDGPVTVETVEIEGDNPQSFKVDGSGCVLVTLAPGRACIVEVETSAGGLAGRATARLMVGVEGSASPAQTILEASGLLG